MRYLLTCFALFMCSYVHAQFEQWDWVRFGSAYNGGYNSYGQSHLPQGNSVAIDAAKNVYVLGTFYDSTQIDTAQLYGDANMFLAKYDKNGNLLWLRFQICRYDNYGFKSSGNALAVDADGNAYIGGDFQDSISFDGIKLKSASSDHSDIFLAKYSTNGEVVWAKRAGSPGSDVIGGSNSMQQGGGMKLDANGYLYFTGTYGGALPVGPVSAVFDTFQLTDNDSYYHGFLAKYDTAGNAIWVKKIATGASIISFDVAFDKNENVFVAGMLGSDSVYFDNIKAGIISHHTTYSNMFLAKYDSHGDAIWAKIRGGNGGTFAASIATDSYGNLIVAGDNANDSVVFDGLTLDGNRNVNTTFIAKYTNDGNILWLKNIATAYSSDNYSNYVTVDANDKLYITGVFKDTCAVGSRQLISNGGEDIYITRYDDEGNLEWVTSIGGSQDDGAFGMYADGNTLYVTGGVLDTCTFGSYSTTGVNANMFVAKLSLPATCTKQISRPANDIKIYPNPASSALTVDVNDASFEQLRISDATGRCMYTLPVTGKQQVAVSTAGLADGLYFVTLSGTNGSVSKKFIVQH